MNTCISVYYIYTTKQNICDSVIDLGCISYQFIISCKYLLDAVDIICWCLAEKAGNEGMIQSITNKKNHSPTHFHPFPT